MRKYKEALLKVAFDGQGKLLKWLFCKRSVKYNFLNKHVYTYETFTLLVCHFFDSVPPPDVKHIRYPECCVLPGVNVIYTSIWPPRDRISVYPFSHQSSCYTSFAYISTWNFFIFFKETFIFKRFSRCFVGKRCHCSFMT